MGWRRPLIGSTHGEVERCVRGGFGCLEAGATSCPSFSNPCPASLLWPVHRNNKRTEAASLDLGLQGPGGGPSDPSAATGGGAFVCKDQLLKFPCSFSRGSESQMSHNQK